MANLTIHKTKFYAGLLWLVEVGRLFIKSPIKWLIIAICLAITIAAAYFSWAFLVILFFKSSYIASIFVGLFVLWIFSFLLFGGLLLSAQSLDEDDDLLIHYLYSGFYYKFRDLMIVSVCSILIIIGVTFLSSMMMGYILKLIVYLLGIFGLLLISQYQFYSILVAAIFMLFPFSVLWFAPALVVFNDKSPLRAIYDSLRIFMRNWLSLSLLWLFIGVPSIMIGLKWKRLIRESSDAILASLGFSVGLLPIFFALLVYVSYRQIIGEPSEVLADSK